MQPFAASLRRHCMVLERIAEIGPNNCIAYAASSHSAHRVCGPKSTASSLLFVFVGVLDHDNGHEESRTSGDFCCTQCELSDFNSLLVRLTDIKVHIQPLKTNPQPRLHGTRLLSFLACKAALRERGGDASAYTTTCIQPRPTMVGSNKLSLARSKAFVGGHPAGNTWR